MIDKRIKLLHITSSLKVGGAETVLCKLLENLSEGFEHHVIYFHDGPMRKRIEDLGIPTYHVKGLLGLYDPLFWWRLFLKVRSIKPDKIHSLLWAANVASRIVGILLRVPVMCVYHNNVDLDGGLRNLLDRLTIGFTDQLVAVSDEVALTISQNAPQISPKNVKVIKNGVNAQALFEKSQKLVVTRASLGLSADHVVIGSVGRFHPIKRYDLLLHAFALLHVRFPATRLVLVGQGPLEQDLRDLAKKLGIADQIIFVVGQQAAGYYPLFDVFVQTTDREGISMALLEAMSCKVACVVTHAGLVHPVLQHGKTGLVVPAGNIPALVDAVTKIVADHSLKRELGAQAYKVVQSEFNEVAMIEKYCDIFTK